MIPGPLRLLEIADRKKTQDVSSGVRLIHHEVGWSYKAVYLPRLQSCMPVKLRIYKHLIR